MAPHQQSIAQTTLQGKLSAMVPYVSIKLRIQRVFLKMLAEGDALTLRGRSFHRNGPALLKTRSPPLGLRPGNLKQVAVSRPKTTAGCVGVQRLNDIGGQTCRVKLDRRAARSWTALCTRPEPSGGPPQIGVMWQARFSQVTICAATLWQRWILLVKHRRRPISRPLYISILEVTTTRRNVSR